MGKKSYERIYDFFKQLDRGLYLTGELKNLSKCEIPLPIGYEQTISQPRLVFEMTVALELNQDCKVLEIGTGSGYQTTFLAEFAKEVYTVEKIEELSLCAQERLKKYKNIHYKIGDGSLGWEENAPYDRIIVTAAASSIPDSLIKQLNINGKMIVPVGPKGLQNLISYYKDENGNIHEENLGKVTFVELKGKYGWNDG